MTSHFLDIHLRPDPEFPPAHLMSALFAKLHRALVARRETKVGVSFPGYSRSAPVGLGSQIRLLGPDGALEALRAGDWYVGMADMVQRGEVLPVPEDAQHRHLKRVQSDSSAARLRRRAMKRHSISELEALQRIPESATRRLVLPYLEIASGSTGQRFRLFLDLQSPVLTPQPGVFNSYGLSDRATTPYF